MSLLKLGFDKVYCLNLTRRLDRRKHAEAQFEKVNLKVDFFPAIDARELGIKCDNERLTYGMVGCYLSHYMILQEALRMGYERILIFEDDLTFITGFNGLMNHAVPIVPDDWEFLYLGYSYANVYEKYRKTEIPVNEYWVIPGHNWGTQCYAINGRNTIIKLLDGLKKINDQVDVQLTFKVLKQKCIKFYAIKPCAVGQLKDRSDVQTR